jgi:hypothetical protein
VGGMGNWSHTHISGSLVVMSATAAIGIPKLLAGPQKSIPISTCLTKSVNSHSIAKSVVATAPGIGSENGRVQETYGSSRGNLCICLSVSSH